MCLSYLREVVVIEEVEQFVEGCRYSDIIVYKERVFDLLVNLR